MVVMLMLLFIIMCCWSSFLAVLTLYDSCWLIMLPFGKLPSIDWVLSDSGSLKNGFTPTGTLAGCTSWIDDR